MKMEEREMFERKLTDQLGAVIATMAYYWNQGREVKTSLFNDRGEFDSREIERIKLLACSATKKELEEALQEALDGRLACLIKLAKHYHSRKDHDRLHCAIIALMLGPEAQAA
jgi:hypothetical protein